MSLGEGGRGRFYSKYRRQCDNLSKESERERERVREGERERFEIVRLGDMRKESGTNEFKECSSPLGAGKRTEMDCPPELREAAQPCQYLLSA